MPITFHKPSNKGKTSSQTIPPGPGESYQPGPVTLLVDKITITAKVPFSALPDIHAAFAAMKENTDLLQATKPSPAYEVVHLIALETGTAHVSFGHKKSYLPDLRLELNPAKLGPSDMEQLRDLLGQLVPLGGWDYLVGKGRVSRVDVAADVIGARMHHFHLLPLQVLTTTTYEHGARLKTIYVGNSKGNQLTAYSKSYQMASEGTPLPGPVVRIEKRLKKVGLPLSSLAELKNPLLGFNIVSTPLGPPPGEDTEKKSYIWKLFLDSVARRTLGPALKLLPSGKMTAYRKHFKGHEQPWWDAHAVWAQWPDTLKKMRLVHTKDWPAY